MKPVNPYFLHTLLEPITGLADDDDAIVRFRGFDPNNELRVREVIRELIVPHERELLDAVRERVKLAYRYYLSKPTGVRFGRVYDSDMPPFDHPDDPRQFFVWIWEECYPGESYQLPDWDSYTENADIHEPLRILMRRHE